MIVIIITLASILIISFEPVRARAEATRCMANLRGLHSGFALYTQEKGRWPQIGEVVSKDSELSARFWRSELRPYVGNKVWECPTYVRHLGENPEERAQAPKLHYAPTQFDGLAFTPYKWPKMPWAIEVGNFHGSGSLVLFPDGSIKSMDEVLGAKFSELFSKAQAPTP